MELFDARGAALGPIVEPFADVTPSHRHGARRHRADPRAQAPNSTRSRQIASVTLLPRWTYACAILLGCAMGREAPSRRAWELYCCQEAASDSPQGCRPIAPELVSACRAVAG